MKMNKYFKEFLHRGLMFAGFGPVIYGIVAILAPNAIVDGKTVFVAILSTYLLAFIHAGVSVFNSIEHWPLAKSLFFHLFTLYLSYLVCYLVNSWIPFDVMNVVWFTVIFAAIYAVVWTIVVLSIKATSKSLNKKLK